MCMLSKHLYRLVICMLCNDWCLTCENNYPYMRKMHPQVAVVFGLWLADGLTVALHLKCHCGILSQHTSVRWHHLHWCLVGSHSGGVRRSEIQSPMRPACLNLRGPNPLSAPSPSSPPVSLLTGMQLEKYLATMTWKSAHLTLSMSLTLHFLHSSFTSAGYTVMLFLNEACVISAVSSLISAWFAS